MFQSPDKHDGRDFRLIRDLYGLYFQQALAGAHQQRIKGYDASRFPCSFHRPALPDNDLAAVQKREGARIGVGYPPHQFPSARFVGVRPALPSLSRGHARERIVTAASVTLRNTSWAVSELPMA